LYIYDVTVSAGLACSEKNSIWLFLICQTNRRIRYKENRIIFDQTVVDSPEEKQQTSINQ
jgi:hypothetical protein